MRSVAGRHAPPSLPAVADQPWLILFSLDLKLAMNTQANLPDTLRHPSAFLPIAMSLLAVGVVLTHIALFGTARQRQADEGTAAHLWQLLMAGQLPIIVFFAIRWLPQAPRYALSVLALQAAAAVAALAPVYLLRW
jgi:hypothetical protein